MTLMGVGTFVIGLLPSYATAGIIAPIILIGLRLAQGLALGGEYGGAAIYVAEHAPHGKRGFYTSAGSRPPPRSACSWRCSSSSASAPRIGDERSMAWGWRIPFLLSILLLAVSIWIRLKLNESPVFKKMKEEGKGSKAPLPRRSAHGATSRSRILAFLRRAPPARRSSGTRAVLRAVLPAADAEGDRSHGEHPGCGLAHHRHAVLHLFGRSRTEIGRKPIIMAGCILAALTYFPIFKGLTQLRQPGPRGGAADERRSPSSPTRPTARSSSTRSARRRSSRCDIAKSALVRPFGELRQRGAPPRTVGGRRPSSFDAAGSPAEFSGRDLAEAAGRGITKHGYPARRQPGRDQLPDDVILLVILVIYVTLVYAPIAAWLVELFPTRIRYTRHVAALPHRQRLVRRLPARHRLRDRGGNRRHLLRPLVPDRRRRDELRHRAHFPPRDQGSRHRPDVRVSAGRPSAAARLQSIRPAPLVRGFLCLCGPWIMQEGRPGPPRANSAFL